MELDIWCVGFQGHVVPVKSREVEVSSKEYIIVVFGCQCLDGSKQFRDGRLQQAPMRRSRWPRQDTFAHNISSFVVTEMALDLMDSLIAMRTPPCVPLTRSFR